MVDRVTSAQGDDAGKPGADGPDIGREIRTLRKAKGLTLERLGAQAGLSVSYLSQIERDISTPSVKVLHDLARALDVTVGWFFDGPNSAPEEERDCIVRQARRRKLHFEAGMTDYLLTPDLSGALELLECVFPPGASSGAEGYRHAGEEAGVVIRGAFELWIGERRHRLEAGDSFRFASTTPHRYANPGDTETVVIWAITPPTY